MGDRTERPDGLHEGRGEAAQDAARETVSLVTVPLDPKVHRFADFVCARSERVQRFLTDGHPRFLERNYCKIFVLPDLEDQTHIWGYYTLSPGLVDKGRVSTQDQKRVMRGLPIPMFLIGFLGRDDRCSKELKLGGVLIQDAALRIHLNPDIACWGIYLDAETETVAKWYEEKMRFKRARPKPPPEGEAEAEVPSLMMYAPLRILLPPGI